MKEATRHGCSNKTLFTTSGYHMNLAKGHSFVNSHAIVMWIFKLYGNYKANSNSIDRGTVWDFAVLIMSQGIIFE